MSTRRFRPAFMTSRPQWATLIQGFLATAWIIYATVYALMSDWWWALFYVGLATFQLTMGLWFWKLDYRRQQIERRIQESQDRLDRLMRQGYRSSTEYFDPIGVDAGAERRQLRRQYDRHQDLTSREREIARREREIPQQREGQ